MVNLYRSSSYRYTGTSRSISDHQYTPADPSYTASSRLYRSVLYNYSSINDRGYYNDSIGTGGATLPPGVDVDVNAASFYAGYKRSSAEALYHQSLLGTHNTIGQSEAWYSTNPLVKRPRFQSSLPVYPQRPGEKDCAHYMLTRTCKFGDSCRFDHPMWVPESGIPDWKEVPVSVTSEDLPDRPGAPDCPFYLKTQMCKFGPRCKFNHPKDKVASLSAIENTEGSELPERPSEPPCVFYMKTGLCKFGLTCKFHHPKDIAITVVEMEKGNGGQMETVATGTNGSLTLANPPFTPAMLHNSKGLPIRPGEADCPFYLKTGSCKYDTTCRYNHPERYAMDPLGAIVANPAVHISMVNPASSFLGTVDPRIAHTTLGLGSAIYPQRPGQMECDYYMKSGQCMFGERCKYHHPLDRTAHTGKEGQQQNVKLTLAGLPRRELGLGSAIYPQRPGQMECDYYMKSGQCMFGERCKYHHPLDRTAHALSGKEGQQQNVKLTLAGLPRREGAENCPYYMKTGACKYGATCRFDHPPPGEVMAAATSQGASVSTGEEVKDGSNGK